MTWARYVRHFFVVTGAGEAEKRILADRTHCVNVTAHHGMEHIGVLHTADNYQMYQCGGIHVLHFPMCDGTGWGSKGPCCRCERTMRYFLDMEVS